MKLKINLPNATPIEIESHSFEIEIGPDKFSLREKHGALLVRLEETDSALAVDLCVLPDTSNGVRLRGLK